MAQNPQLYDPAGTYVNPVVRAWASTGNTDVVSDEGVEANTVVLIMPTSAYAGRWYVSNVTPTSFATSAAGVVTETAGSFTVTSSSSETQTTTTYKYILV